MQVQRKNFPCSYHISAEYTGKFYKTHSVKEQNFLKKSYRIGSSFHQKSIEVHRTENNVERRSKGFAFFAPRLPLCAALRNRWNSCRIRQFGANLPRFWAKGKRGYWELISAKGDFDRCEKCLQVKASHQMGWRFLKSPAVRGFFSSQN